MLTYTFDFLLKYSCFKLVRYGCKGWKGVGPLPKEIRRKLTFSACPTSPAFAEGASEPTSFASDFRDRVPVGRSSFSVRSRRALPITLTEDRLMASAAIIGDSKSPVTG